MIWKLFHKLFGTFSFPIYVNVGEKVKCTPWNNLALETDYLHPLALNKDNFLNRETSWSDYDTAATNCSQHLLNNLFILITYKYSNFGQIKNTCLLNSCQKEQSEFYTVQNKTFNHHTLSSIFTTTLILWRYDLDIN